MTFWIGESHGRSTHLEFRMPNPELVATDHIAKLVSAVGHFFRAAVRGVSAADGRGLLFWVYGYIE